MDEKTNVMRLLDAKKIKYRAVNYVSTGAVAGTEVAAVLNEAEEKVFKTLVTVGKKGGHYVFVIPVAHELDLKKAAAACGEKAVEMLKAKELLPLTGYVHGGCSPIGMKKFFPTYFHETADNYDTIYFSAGKIGFQVELSPAELSKIIRFAYADITVSER